MAGGARFKGGLRFYVHEKLVGKREGSAFLGRETRLMGKYPLAVAQPPWTLTHEPKSIARELEITQDPKFLKLSKQEEMMVLAGIPSKKKEYVQAVADLSRELTRDLEECVIREKSSKAFAGGVKKSGRERGGKSTKSKSRFRKKR